MSTRLDRYLVVAQLANLILEGQPHHDEFRIEQAVQDLRDAVAAGRRDQDRFAAEVRKLADRMQTDQWSRRADLPHLTIVKGD